MHTNLINTILWQSLAIFLIIGALMGIAVSLVLIFKPQLMARINRLANRWITTRRMNRFLDRSVSIERGLHKYHRQLGILIMLGAGYILMYFGLLFDKAAALQRWAGSVPTRLLDGLLDAMVLAGLTGAVVALLIGLSLWLRPSLLRGIEDKSNQWVSSRRATRALDIPRDQVERYVAGHAQRVGWLLLLGSLYLFFAMLRVLI